MYINNYIHPIPTKELLDQCHKVIAETTGNYASMKQWCRDLDLSLFWSEHGIEDHGETSVGRFYFVEQKDATLFRLKWI